MVTAMQLAIVFPTSTVHKKSSGLFEVSRLRIRRLGRAGNHRAKRIQRFLDSPEDFLWTVLVGNTIANCIAVTIAFIFLQQHLVHPFGFWAAFAVCGVFFYAFFEYLPKTLFRLHPDSLCLAFSNPVRVHPRTPSVPLRARQTANHRAPLPANPETKDF